MQRKRPIHPIVLILSLVAFSLFSCGEDEEAIMIANLTADLQQAGAAMDSLNYEVDAVNLLLDEARQRADSLQRVDDKLLASVQKLNKEVRQWKNLYTEQKTKNKQLEQAIERFKREKQADRQAIAQLRSQADSLNVALLESNTSIRRQGDHLRRVELELAQTQDELEDLKKAQVEVRVLVATEDFLKENGYLDTSRPFGGGFRKSYKMVKKLELADPRVRKVPVGEALILESKLKEVVDRYGKLKKGDDYEREKEEDGLVKIIFRSEMLGGTDVLAVVEE